MRNVEALIQRNSWYGVKPLVARLISFPLVNWAVRAVASMVLPEKTLHRLPFRSGGEYLLMNGERIILVDPRDQVAKDFRWGGGRPVSDADARLLRYVETSEARLFIDAGAYSAAFALIAARSGMRAIAFEILPENYLMAVRNVIANDLVEEVDIRLCGLADRHSHIIMPVSTKSAGHPSSASLSADFTEGIRIPTVTIDSLNLDGPMLWKLDVEGFEWAVLQGAKETVQRAKPDIICEILPGFPYAAEIEDLLRPLGYSFFISLEDGFERRDHLAGDPAGRDWIFTRGEIGDLSNGRAGTSEP